MRTCACGTREGAAQHPWDCPYPLWVKYEATGEPMPLEEALLNPDLVFQDLMASETTLPGSAQHVEWTAERDQLRRQRSVQAQVEEKRRENRLRQEKLAQMGRWEAADLIDTLRGDQEQRFDALTRERSTLLAARSTLPEKATFDLERLDQQVSENLTRRDALARTIRALLLGAAALRGEETGQDGRPVYLTDDEAAWLSAEAARSGALRSEELAMRLARPEPRPDHHDPTDDEPTTEPGGAS